MTKTTLIVAIVNVVLRLAMIASPRLYRKPRDLAALEPDRILVSRPDHIGDAVLATPAIRAIRRRFPAAKITFAVASWSAPMFAELQEVDELFVIDPPWWVAKRRLGETLASRLRVWRAFIGRLIELRRRRFDLCVELRGDVRQILAFGVFARAKVLVAYRRNGGHFLTDGWLRPQVDRHEALQDLDLTALLGCDQLDPEPRIVAGPSAHAAVASLLLQSNVSGDDLIVVVHPSAKQANAWPARHFQALLETLTKDEAVRVLLTGGPGDRPLHAILETVCPRRITSFAGLPLLQVAALFERAHLVVTADTGPMHLLNGTTTRSVLLFGPTRPARFAPFGDRHRILSAGWCCNAHLHDICRLDPTADSGRCMQALGVDRVACTARTTIDEIRSAGQALRAIAPPLLVDSAFLKGDDEHTCLTHA